MSGAERETVEIIEHAHDVSVEAANVGEARSLLAVREAAEAMPCAPDNDARGFSPQQEAPETNTGYLAPDGTHHSCAAWDHRPLARRICRALGIQRESFAPDDPRAAWIDASNLDPLDPEQELDRRGYVRIQCNDRDALDAVSWIGDRYDPTATLTDEQVSWLRVRGYKRWLRYMVELRLGKVRR